MRRSTLPIRRAARATRLACTALVIAGGAVLAGAPRAQADDRDLLRASSGRPMVFILFDTSGSMNWAPPCSQADFDAIPQRCAPLCPTGDCYVPLQGDDPGSKFYQARKALYKVIDQVENVDFGWASFNQDDVRVRGKHWVYRAAEDGPTISGFGPYPAEGDEDVFGRHWNCNVGNNDPDDRIGCNVNTPADLDDPWERRRVQRLPKGNANFQATQTFYVRQGGTVFRIRYQPLGASPGDASVDVRVNIDRHQGGANYQSVIGSPRTVTFTLDGPFTSWDLQVNRQPFEQGFFPQGNAANAQTANTCAGWDPNTDSGADTGAQSINLRFPTVDDDDFGAPLSRGDVLPWDWRNDNREAILDRLAPNRLLGEGPPDFTVARYFRDTPGAGGWHNLQSPEVRTLIPSGATPLSQMLGDFRDWYGDWKAIGQAEIGDTEFDCRPKYVLLLTDGDHTCTNPQTDPSPRDPCGVAEELLDEENIQTFVVGFGLPDGTGNTLECIAANGAPPDENGDPATPYLPTNEAGLIEALLAIVGEISEQAATFASPSVSQQTVNDREKIFLPSFTPATGSAYWPGGLDAFLQPVPLIESGPDEGKPNTGRTCGGTVTSGCFLWDAQEQTLEQVDPNDFLGTGSDQRRVFYSQYSKEPGAWAGLRRTFDAPPLPAQDTGMPSIRYDLWRALGLLDSSDPDGSLSETEEDGLRDATADVITRTLEAKQVTVNLPEGQQAIDFVLGDFFHSTPLVVSNPPASRLFITDAGLDQDAECQSGDGNGNRGYRCFFNRHQQRRKVLLAGSNDGMLHAFDAGIFRGSSSEGEFDNGEGHELWAYMPRTIMPTVTRLAEGSNQDWGVDGPPAAVDAFIDPLFTGSSPDPDERQWRTVVVGGLREGGRGYYALDVTQPDSIGDDFVPDVAAGAWMPGCLGTPLEAGSSPPAGCGPVPYPAPLWELDDSLPRPGGNPADDPPGGLPVLVDEDRNGEGDLGDTWSTPSLGRILVCKATGSCNPNDESNANPYDPGSSGGLEVKTVAIFGGGMDVDSKDDPTNAQRGNWLYMVDVETGQTLYKRQLIGAAPADVAAVDTDGDGFLDRVYVPTLAGKLYRVDLIADPDGDLPKLEPFEVSTLECDAAGDNCPEQLRIVDDDPTDVDIASWDPYIIFDASADGVNRPLYIRPTVFFVAGLRQYAVGLGTGDREDLWSTDGPPGRFFVFADDRPLEPGGQPPGPLTAADLIRLTVGQTTFTAAGTHDALLMPGEDLEGRGWYFELDPDERVNQPAFALSGVLIFSTFIPAAEAAEAEAVCGVSGVSRVFGVNTVNASGLMGAAGSEGEPPDQYVTIDNFVSNPFAQAGGISEGSEDEGGNDEMPPAVQDVFDGLQALFPANCTFANYRVDVRMVASDTSLQWPASVPVCIVQKNWKEF